MKFSFFKKIIPIVIIISLVFGSLGNIFVKKAEALSPGGAVGKAVAAGAACFFASKIEAFVAGLATRKKAIVEGYSDMGVYTVSVPSVALNNPAVAQSTETSDALTKSKDCIRDVVAKILLDWIVDETIKWIQGGGEPAFVGDWGNFMDDAFQAGVGTVAQELGLSWLCSPFGLQLQLSIGYLPVERFSQRVECTLDDIVANIDDFFENFENGGWIAYNEIWQPQNNFYGVMLMAHDEMLIRGAKAKDAAKTEAIAGAGFLSQKRCETAATYGKKEDCAAAEGRSCAKDSEGDWCSASDIKITTPGDTVGEIAANAMKVDTEWAKNIRSWVAALTNAIINRLFNEGLSMMRGSAEPQPASYGDFDPYKGLDPVLDEKKKFTEYIISEYQKILDDREVVLAYKNQSIVYAETILAGLNTLENRDCSVSNNEINIAQSEINRLQNEINNIQNFINEINILIAAANNITEFRDREIAILEQNYNEFIGQYNSIYIKVIDGSDKETAQNEASSNQTELNNIQIRLDACPKTSTSTQS